MRLKRSSRDLPAVIVIPMIDIMFFLLVFFMLGTMYMTNLQTVSVKLGDMEGAQITQEIAFAVSVNEAGEIFIGDRQVDLPTVKAHAGEEIRRNPNAVIVLRVDAGSPYDVFSRLLETLKAAGVARFAIAANTGE